MAYYEMNYATGSSYSPQKNEIVKTHSTCVYKDLYEFIGTRALAEMHIEYVDDGIKLYGANVQYYWSYGVGVYKKVDLTNYNTLKIKHARDSQSGRVYLLISKTDIQNSYGGLNNVNALSGDTIKYYSDSMWYEGEYDVSSLSGEYYVGIIDLGPRTNYTMLIDCELVK